MSYYKSGELHEY